MPTTVDYNNERIADKTYQRLVKQDRFFDYDMKRLKILDEKLSGLDSAFPTEQEKKSEAYLDARQELFDKQNKIYKEADQARDNDPRTDPEKLDKFTKECDDIIEEARDDFEDEKDLEGEVEQAQKNQQILKQTGWSQPQSQQQNTASTRTASTTAPAANPQAQQQQNQSQSQSQSQNVAVQNASGVGNPQVVPMKPVPNAPNQFAINQKIGGQQMDLKFDQTTGQFSVGPNMDPELAARTFIPDGKGNYVNLADALQHANTKSAQNFTLAAFENPQAGQALSKDIQAARTSQNPQLNPPTQQQVQQAAQSQGQGQSQGRMSDINYERSQGQATQTQGPPNFQGFKNQSQGAAPTNATGNPPPQNNLSRNH